MKSIGQIVKMIRQIKGFTQSEVYSGVMSRSFAHRFENGEHDISATKLFQILDNLLISVEEFRFIQNDYHRSSEQELNQQLQDAYDVHNLQEMGNIINENKNSGNLSFKSIAGIGQVLVETYQSKTFVITPAMESFWNQLFNSKAWTLQEIRNADILLPIAINSHRESLIPTIVNRFENNCQKYLTARGDPFHVSDELMGMYLTLLQTDLNTEQYDSANQLVSKARDVDKFLLTWNGRFAQQLIIAIWNLYFGSEEEGETIIAKISGAESLYVPPIDHNLKAIADMRRKLAKIYKKRHTD
ncbi:helix-turn-helix domain-containing protein [Lentilactobacillus kefiri]|uniref:Helix-turn-helix domain-containing protein n=2 Tax=Lentilactobacillus kefiri TaxID=33962 RepID=A0A8E1RJE2_LENKE|nr:helix-turn-helix transcriptional regulator [Lentilactobacillus kefiri]KRL57646.1 helix-turn-helix domain-containing protein [Lentilactobacillus parakefiri DSM 10551]KRM52189.1 helix-turn-helix domain-containing protein [Lentilactobacillus kefiri DSM 20587 = JCM 5818]MDH5108137.1 helix-turn-helix transcriptional regulator [Lentilactobacillus kefiri]MDM7492895.1 helix-turn-helix transcriptional regulator [Lentilactobacillus kefiri]PAK60334.1 transcriptional regulator [Lentilactobacillus kefir